ncbi:hypothetical protein CLOM_g3684, partial [Closterium sp. NIES-68]
LLNERAPNDQLHSFDPSQAVAKPTIDPFGRYVLEIRGVVASRAVSPPRAASQGVRLALPRGRAMPRRRPS